MYVLTLPIKLLERTVGGNDILIRVHINYILRFCTCWENKEEEEDVQMVNFKKELQKYLSQYGQPLCVERMCRMKNLLKLKKYII